QQALENFLHNVQRKNWDGAYAQIANTSQVDKASFIRDIGGADGSLRNYSGLSSWQLNPLHATDNDADIRAELHWSTPVGPTDNVRELKIQRDGNAWKVVWPAPHFPDVPAQVIPVNYLRWDVVSPGAGDEWGNRGVDGPHVRIVSMNAVSYQG